ncbi:MAG: polysaccharide pyruvyl transferase family protein [Sedimentisphaerales bacterium]|nr:polysaccharide pyruvyl transferase family protein [Sedimentisphaerales bacterium]
MKIVIIDAYHDSDRGGVGILSGLLNTLRAVTAESKELFEVSIVYRFSDDDPRFSSATRHISRSYPDVPIYGSPVRTTGKCKGLRHLVERCRTYLGSFLKLVCPALFRDRAVAAINSADIVISKGGQFYRFTTTSSFRGFLSSYMAFYTALICIRLRKRLAFVSHTFGPFINSGSKCIARYVLNKAFYVGCRESISREVLLELGIEPAKLDVIPDTAFALSPASDQWRQEFLKKKGISPESYAIVIAKNWTFDEHSVDQRRALYERYVRVMARVSDYLGVKADTVLLVVHNDGKHSDNENDSVPVGDILDHMELKEKAVVVNDDLSAREQSVLYGGAQVVVATRLHAAIFALIAGAPCVAISYSHKTEGIMQMVGLGRYVVDIATFDYAQTVRLIDEISSNWEKIGGPVNDRIESFTVQLRSRVQSVLSLS